jgi:hypothetical protein
MPFVSRLLKKPEKLAQGAGRQLNDATLLITHAEVSVRHGTGALLKNIFRDEKEIVIFHSQSFFDTNEIGTYSHRVWHGPISVQKVVARIRKILDGITVRRILCVPFYQDDVLSALAAAKLTGAPMALYIMDDQNIHVQEISDPLMSQLIAVARVRFAISEQLRQAYSRKYRKPFWFLPPVIAPELLAPPSLDHTSSTPPRGTLIGNIWSLDVLRDFRRVIKESGLKIDWFGNAGKPFIELSPIEAELEGLTLHAIVPDEELVRSLRTADFAVVPSGTLAEDSSHNWLAKASLPSRIIYLMATANIPIIVMGHPETAAARFVERLGLGAICSYDSQAFLEAVGTVTGPERFLQIRLRANELGPKFSADGIADFIWNSLGAGRPIDKRFNEILMLISESTSDTCSGQEDPGSIDTSSEVKKPFVQQTSTAMLTRIKDKISCMAQRALGIDGVQFKLDAVTNKLDQLDPKFEKLFWEIRQTSEGLDRLKSFLTWSANRVEPWLPAESFSQTEPDYDLAGFLYNFFPNRLAADIGIKDSEFAKALSEIGYQVLCFASAAEAFGSLKNEMQIDLLKIDTGDTDLEAIKGLTSVRPAVVQIEFFSEDRTSQSGKNQSAAVSASEKIKAMRDLEYYWNIIIFRVDSEDFVRMATNLAGTPKQSWGKIFFFQDYQLFLKALHWCKGALPRFRASALRGR